MLAHDQVLALINSALDLGDPADTAVATLLHELADILRLHGVEVAAGVLALTPIALARGDSRRQLEEVLSRYRRGLISSAFLSLDPGNKRFPTSFTETGQACLSSLGLSPNRGTR